MTTTIAAREADTITPFTLDVPQADLDDLRARIEASRLPAPIGADDWSTGVPLGVLQDGLDYWSSTFDWRALEQRVNELPQFLTEIDGQRFHFLHVESSQADATPIVLLHGWPGSFLEFLDVIPLLTEPAANGASERSGVQRRGAEPAGLRLVDAARRRELDDQPHRQGRCGADGAARLRAIRHPGRRLRRGCCARGCAGGSRALRGRARERLDRGTVRRAERGGARGIHRS